MTEIAPATRPPVPRKIYFGAFVLPVAALILAGISTWLCRAATGVSLGLFFGGVGVATLITPPMATAETSLGRRVLVAVAAASGVAVVWQFDLGDLLTLNQWVACSGALLAYALALAGLCSLLLATRCNAVFAAGAVTLVASLWLTWPVWLSHALLEPAGDTLVAWLVPAHPLFAINGVLLHFDSWDRHPLAYTRLMVLNQDVFYAMPSNVLWTTVTHALIAAISTVVSCVVSSVASRAGSCPEPAVK